MKNDQINTYIERQKRKNREYFDKVKGKAIWRKLMLDAQCKISSTRHHPFHLKMTVLQVRLPKKQHAKAAT